MKVKAMFLFMVAVAVLVSCTNEESPAEQTTGRSNLTLSIKGEKQSIAGRAAGNPSDADQSKVNDFIIFVFKTDGSNDIEPKEVTANTSGKVNLEISTDAKEVYVIANTKSDNTVNAALLAVTKKSELQAVTGRAFAGTGQTASCTQTSTNLWMSGNSNVAPQDGQNVTVAVTLKYVAAMVRITSVTVDPSLTNLTLESVVMLNAGAATCFIPADGSSSLIPNNYTPDASAPFYVHGIGNNFANKPTISGRNDEYLFTLTGSPAEIKTGSNQHYFYVFENDGIAFEGQPTILTLKATNNATDVYYSVFFKMNIQPGDGYDNQVIERGKCYNVSMNIKAAGSTDPTIPARKTTVDVTITPAEWKTVNISKEYQ